MVELFQTPQLLIRQLKLEDFPNYFEMQSNPNVLKYTDGIPETKEECEVGLKKFIKNYEEKNAPLHVWAVTQKSNNAFVGTAAIVFEKNGEGEIGYRFLEKYWGNGFGSEVMKGLVDFAFQELKLKAIFATVDVLNIASVKILEKSILKFEKEEWSEKYKSQDRWYRLENPY